MSHDAQLLLLGAAIALVSSLSTLVISARMFRQGGARPARSDPEMAEWTGRYVQAMREAAEAKKGERT
jgi:hypothetical protein